MLSMIVQPKISSVKLLAIWFLVLKHDMPFIASWLISENNLLNFAGIIDSTKLITFLLNLTYKTKVVMNIAIAAKVTNR